MIVSEAAAAKEGHIPESVPDVAVARPSPLPAPKKCKATQLWRVVRPPVVEIPSPRLLAGDGVHFAAVNYKVLLQMPRDMPVAEKHVRPVAVDGPGNTSSPCDMTNPSILPSPLESVMAIMSAGATTRLARSCGWRL
jgi:hypothetical protein